MLKVTEANQEITKIRLEKAMKRNHPVTVTYTKADGERTVRTIEIFEIKESKAGDFYVRAMDRKTGEARSFRIDRMHAITIHRTSFTMKRPTNFKEVIMAMDSGAQVISETFAEQVARQHEERFGAYAAGSLKAGQFLSASNAIRYGEQRVDGVCGLDPQRDRRFILNLLERPERMTGAIEWVRPTS